jgi:hypothetical protein
MKMGRYYGQDYNRVATELTEVDVAVHTMNGTYTSRFTGSKGPLQAIEFVNSVKQVVGKELIYEVRISTWLAEHEPQLETE